MIRLSAKFLGQYVGKGIDKLSDEGYFPRAEEGTATATAIETLKLSEGEGASVNSGSVKKSADSSSQSHKVKVATKFSHVGKYDLLESLEINEQTSISAVEPDRSAAKDKAQDPIPLMMPSFDAGFWMVYGNRLQVNGTVEGLCYLAG